MKNRWLDRAVVFGLSMTLCTTEAQYLREFKRRTKRDWSAASDESWCTPGMACVHFLVPQGGGTPAAIVCIDLTRGDDVIRGLTLLAHEATHVKQRLMTVMGEDKPSDEFEAYVVQNICHELFSEFERQWPSLPTG